MDNLTSDYKVKVNFCLPDFSPMKIVKWEWHMDDSVEIRYDMVLDQYPLTMLGLNFKFSKHGIKGGGVLFESCTEPVVNLVMYELKILNIDKITTK